MRGFLALKFDFLQTSNRCVYFKFFYLKFKILMKFTVYLTSAE